MCIKGTKEFDEAGLIFIPNSTEDNLRENFLEAHKRNSSKVYYSIVDDKIYTYGEFVANELLRKYNSLFSRIHLHIGNLIIKNSPKLKNVKFPKCVEGNLIIDSSNAIKNLKADYISFNEVLGSVTIKKVKLLEKIEVVGSYIEKDLVIEECRKIVDLYVFVDDIYRDIDVDNKNIVIELSSGINVDGDVYIDGKGYEIKDFYHEFSNEKLAEIDSIRIFNKEAEAVK